MWNVRRTVEAAVLAGLLAIGVAAAYGAVGVVRRAHAVLVPAQRAPADSESAPPASPAPPPPRGRIEAVRREPMLRTGAREVLRIDLDRLQADETYSVWGDDPLDASSECAAVEPGIVVPSRRGDAEIVFDTATGCALPFGATLDELAGRRVELRDGEGAVVLVGVIPAPVRVTPRARRPRDAAIAGSRASD